jgi:transcription termination factor Rho
VDSQLERSVLEKKDRDELQSIAVALGGKPGSRARKADIVDLILELAGVVPAADGPDAADAPAADEPADDSRSDDSRSGGDGSDGKTSASRTAAGKTAEGATAEDKASETTTSADTTAEGTASQGKASEGKVSAGRASGGRGAGGKTAKESDADGTSGGEAADQDASDDADNADGPGSDQTDADNERGEGEGSNRRRRRRGRGRGDDGDQQFQGDPVEVAGFLDLRDEGYGFLRTRGFLPTKEDVYVSVKQVRQYGLRKGDHLTGTSRPASRTEKNPAMLRLDSVNGGDPEAGRERPRFEDLTPLFPDERLRLERADQPFNMTTRIIDLIAPIGKGQRGMIVSPPKAGKTTILKTIAQSIEANHPEVHLLVLLLDERPEEVTDMARSVKGEVIASTFDRPSEEHTMVAELTIERAKRMVEAGEDVVIVLDGITRLARAYNLAAPPNGRVMSGGLDTGALYPPKRFFGAARNVEEGGSLTILATALVDTGSKMDEVIFEEFKGTGNMELRLDRHLAERRIYPAIDVDASSTRHEELLFERKQLQMVWKLRRVLSGLASDGGRAGAGAEMLIDRLGSFKSNEEFLAEVAKAPAGS